MPVVTIERKALFDAIGKQYTQQEFDELCFEFGIELDDFGQDGAVDKDGKSEAAQLKIEIPANRSAHTFVLCQSC